MWGYWYFSWQSWFQVVPHPAQYFTWWILHISEINRVTVYSLILLSHFRNSPLFHVWFNYCFLTCIHSFQEAGQMVWYSHLLKNFPQFFVIHTVKSYGIVNGAKVDVLGEFPCFLYDWMGVGNLISDSSDFSKSSLNIWKLLKPGLENSEHYLLVCEMSANVQ